MSATEPFLFRWSGDNRHTRNAGNGLSKLSLHRIQHDMSHIFVSHASEDKAKFVRPLANALKAHGLKLWYDEFSLRPGDSLRRSIDRGLAECTVGLVVLSPSFFAKEWPQREMDGLFATEIAGQSRLIPIWYQIDFRGVASRSPLIADRIALNAELGVEELAARIADLFPPPSGISGTELAQRLEHMKHFGLSTCESIYAGCWYRFLQINAFKEEYQELLQSLTSPLSDEEVECWPKELEERLLAEQERIRLKHRLSRDIYLTIDDPIRESEFGWWKNTLASWSSGTMSKNESASLVGELDLE